MLTTSASKAKAMIALIVGGLLPLTIFLWLTWLSVKYQVHVLHSDYVFWLGYVVIALPLFWYGLGYWFQTPLRRCFLSLAIGLIWAIAMVISVFFFHLSIGGTL